MKNQDSLITMCPTLIDPRAISTVPELRAALKRANDELFSQAQQLHEQKSYCQQMDQALFGLVGLYRKGELKAVLAQLDDLSKRCKR